MIEPKKIKVLLTWEYEGRKYQEVVSAISERSAKIKFNKTNAGKLISAKETKKHRVGYYRQLETITAEDGYAKEIPAGGFRALLHPASKNLIKAVA